MELQSVFYTVAIIYMLVNILILLGIGIGIFLIFRIARDIRRKTMEKIKYVENALRHPEEIIAVIAVSLIKNVLRKGRSMFRRKRDG